MATTSPPSQPVQTTAARAIGTFTPDGALGPDAWERVLASNVRYRFVIDNATLKVGR